MDVARLEQASMFLNPDRARRAYLQLLGSLKDVKAENELLHKAIKEEKQERIAAEKELSSLCKSFAQVVKRHEETRLEPSSCERNFRVLHEKISKLEKEIETLVAREPSNREVPDGEYVIALGTDSSSDRRPAADASRMDNQDIYEQFSTTSSCLSSADYDGDNEENSSSPCSSQTGSWNAIEAESLQQRASDWTSTWPRRNQRPLPETPAGSAGKPVGAQTSHATQSQTYDFRRTNTFATIDRYGSLSLPDSPGPCATISSDNTHLPINATDDVSSGSETVNSGNTLDFRAPNVSHPSASRRSSTTVPKTTDDVAEAAGDGRMDAWTNASKKQTGKSLFRFHKRLTGNTKTKAKAPRN